ncbi:MAG: dehydrogenase [Prevotella sp.]|nr:dehydrogenase [Prevotella sp.]
MADGYLEKRQLDYEIRKEAFLRKKGHKPPLKRRLQRPDDEAL